MIPPSSSEPPNLHAGLGADDAGRRVLWPGTIAELENRGFRLQGEISHGATAVVHLAKEELTGRKVAVKVCFDPGDHLALDLFERERQILATDNVPHDILPHYYTGVERPGPPRPGADPCQPFLVMEFIDGRKLPDYIAEARDFPLVDKVRLLARLARCVQRLHDSNLIHGDLSPNNILVQKGDRIRLIDMGQGGRLAKGYHSLRSVSGRGGTDGCSSAALLARKEKPGRPSDIRQLVAVAYHTFTGHSAGSDTEEAGKARRTAELDQAGLPPALVRSLLKGLRDRNSRLDDNAPDPRLYATAGEFADDLEGWCVARENRQKRWRVAVLVALLVAPALGLSGYFWNQSEVARQAYESRQVEELVDQSDRLANASHPAVKSLLDASLEEKRAEDHARRTGDPTEAKRHLVARRELLRRAIRTSEELLRCQPLREHLTTVLTKSPWTMSAPKITRSVEALRTMSEEIRLLLEHGETDEALVKLARFHRQLAETADENTAARVAADSRDGYERLKKQIPERLQSHAGLAPIPADFARAEQTWKAGEWDAATLSFGQLQQTLDGWLKKNANAEELAALQQASVESIERLEREKGEFRAEIAQQKTRIGELQTQIT
ncbi:MAG: protein kinase, partial [Planctomycetota bacterium]|nr:protein kinase [Planctomycetota bacterium]